MPMCLDASQQALFAPPGGGEEYLEESPRPLKSLTSRGQYFRQVKHGLSAPISLIFLLISSMNVLTFLFLNSKIDLNLELFSKRRFCFALNEDFRCFRLHKSLSAKDYGCWLQSFVMCSSSKLGAITIVFIIKFRKHEQTQKHYKIKIKPGFEINHLTFP